MKLYPPIIEGTLPAFYGSIIKVPFTMNKSVSKQDIDGFALKIKTVQNQINISKEAIIVGTEAWDKNSNIINFNIEDNIQSKLNVGQFYKVQLAYVNGEDIGYYSTIGVIKYTSDPLLSLSSEDGQTYSGIYSQKLKDISEKLYSYSFTLIDSLNNIIETSGEQIHNSSNDTNSYESINLYTINTDLEKNKIYHLIYKIKTINGLEKTIQTKGFSSIENIDSSLKVNIICNVNCEEGSIDIGLEPLEEQFVSGTYYLLRSSNENNFKSWSEIFNFSLHGKKLPKQLFKDMAIKQGVRYKYAIQQYNSHGLRTKRVETKYSVQADFEHSYLYDGERQLKIKYNPKVTSFKTTLMETKIDTIGNKHPFIFRNGTVEYKEFPISGLISCLSDENKMFDIDLFYDNNDVENIKTNLSLKNIYTEREFKIDVLNWLNNGKPKLFKSPVEGNYIVRLMNVALSPIDTLGRMLHSFNCTAYEIAENNYNNLKKFNFIKTNNVIEQRLQWMSVNLIDCQSGVNILKHSANSIKFEGLTPGNKIKIDNENIVIGATGNYSIDLNNNINIEKIELIDEDVEGILTYSYYTSDFQNGFNNINKIENVFIPCHQFIGENNNIIQEINNIKENITSIAYIKFYLRNADNILYKDKENYYSDSKLNNKVDIASLTDIYQVYNKQNGEWVKDNWLDGYNNLTYNNNIEKSSVFITINDKKEKIDLKEIKQYYIKNPKDINSIKTSVGVIAEIGYWKTILFYDMEENEKLMNKYNYKKENEELIELINNSTEYYRLKEQQDKRNNIYKQYCNELNNIITEAEGG